LTRHPQDLQEQNTDTQLVSWFAFLLSVYVLVQMFILLIFINSAMRYLVDVSPALIVLSTIFLGYYLQRVDRNPYLRKAIAFLWILASALTVLAGFLIGFTGDKNNFLNQNPRLYYQLMEWFSR
jgi:branched-subunit amino acid ABC-type transport system permease component